MDINKRRKSKRYLESDIVKWQEAYLNVKREMESNVKNDILFDTGEIYAASTDDINFVVIDEDIHFFNGIQVTQDEIIVNLDELVNRIELKKIKEIKWYK